MCSLKIRNNAIPVILPAFFLTDIMLHDTRMFVGPYAAFLTLLSTGLSTLMAKTPIQITKRKPLIHIQAGTGKNIN